MANWSVEAEDLTRTFGDFTAVDHISFRVREGQIFGFLGPNGAGKSTTIRMLAGILPPTSGTGRVAGFDMRAERRNIKQAIGYMSQKFSLYEDLTVRENLAFFGGVYGATDLDWAVRVCRLESVLDSICSSLSAGLRQRAALACAVVHRPRIVFLDEPTAGVDPASRRSFWELIYALAQEGVTVFVSTHYMDEAEHCDWLALIDAGKIVASGSPADLRKTQFHARLLEVDAESTFRWIDALEKTPGIDEVAMHGNRLHLTVTDPVEAERCIRAVGQQLNFGVNSILDHSISGGRFRFRDDAPAGRIKMPFAASLTGGSKMTLTESCIAAAVVSTLMAIAVPSFVRAKETYTLASAARDVASKMHATRIAAIVRNQDCRLTVTSATSYVMECQETTSSWQIVERITLSNDITVTANARPEFHRRGNVSPTATFTVRNPAGSTARVVVNVNGRVRVQ